jgi:Iodothyronine deiodinase
MQKMADDYTGRAAFVTVYIKEAHPEDEWQMDSNETEGVCYRQPKTLAERLLIVHDFVARHQYRIPLLVDGIDNRADELYAGWPERLYVIDEAGVIVYKGKPGPFGYHPEEVEAWLAQRFGAAPAPAG